MKRIRTIQGGVYVDYFDAGEPVYPEPEYGTECIECGAPLDARMKCPNRDTPGDHRPPDAPIETEEELEARMSEPIVAPYYIQYYY